MTTHIRFYFDYTSPYAYANWVNLQRLEREYGDDQLKVSYHPISFPRVLRAWNNTPPSSIPPKISFVFKDIYRYSQSRNITFSVPKKFPFTSGLLLCLSLPSVSGVNQPKIIAALWQAIWGNPKGEGINPNNEEDIRKVLVGLGLDAEELLSIAKSKVVRDELIDATAEAVEKYRIFGVPTMLLSNAHIEEEDPELFFGNDQILQVRYLLDGGADHLRCAPEPVLRFLEKLPSSPPPVSIRRQQKKTIEKPIAQSKL